jgi:DNA replication and repair protein RecF
MTSPQGAGGGGDNRTWIGKLTLTDFRNYRSATLIPTPAPAVLFGANGAGKTNCLEAISLLTAGRGLRSLPFSELARNNGAGGWAVAARVFAGGGEIEIGTGVQVPPGGVLGARTPRVVKIDGAMAKGSGALARIRMVWLTPAMDGLFTGAASERRRFIDRLALSLDPAYASAAATFDRAMRQRNKALEDMSPPKLLDGIEVQMAEAAAKMAAMRHRAIEALAAEIAAERARVPDSAFPWAELSLVGHLEAQIAPAMDELEAQPGDRPPHPSPLPEGRGSSAADGSGVPSPLGERDRVRGDTARASIQASYLQLLASSRGRDREAGRTLVGPHRSDLEVTHGPKAMPAKMCSTGEQKALLVGLALAQARLVKEVAGGIAPLILLDEIAAHLDEDRRAALFASIASLNAQVWMTGTDSAMFVPLRDATEVQFFRVSDGAFTPINSVESGSNPHI